MQTVGYMLQTHLLWIRSGTLLALNILLSGFSFLLWIPINVLFYQVCFGGIDTSAIQTVQLNTVVTWLLLNPVQYTQNSVIYNNNNTWQNGLCIIQNLILNWGNKQDVEFKEV